MATNTKEYNKAFYQKNREKRKDQIQTRNKIAIERNKDKFMEWIKEQKCQDCQFDDWRILQLDHVSGEKRNDVSTMVISAYSWETILIEIQKCEVVCPNCHHIRTGETFGFWRFNASKA